MSAAPIEQIQSRIDAIDRAQLPWRRFASQFAESKIAMFGLAMLLVVVAIALFAPWIAPQNPYDLTKLDLLDSRQPPGTEERSMA